jgi:putative restriction endonuclease
MDKRNLWTRNELILAFNLYLKLPFGKLHTKTPEIIELAALLGRTNSSITLRLTNFASCDPYHQNRGVKGMEGGKKQCQPIWDEFFSNQENLIFESEKILAEMQHQTLETKYEDLFFDVDNLKGETKLREVKTRVNQHVFRQMVLANYNGKCAITSIDIPDLLFASHIIPWSKNEKERLNPENGICLSALYDKAYDKGLIGINENYELLLSTDLKKRSKSEYYGKHFAILEGTKIDIPKKYPPNKDFLQYHLDIIFKK